MAHLVAPQAETDLDDIWFYVAVDSGSMDIASRLVDSITDKFFFLRGSLMRGDPGSSILEPECEAFLLVNS